nr:thiamine pyrophosphate-binding protein [Desulfobacterales bacterium]
MPKPSEPTPEVPAGVLERSPNAGEWIAEALKEEGVEYIFGVMGGHEWPWLDPICRAGIKHITVRHEQSAGYAAEAYARVKGKIGVCNVTVGPGATNIFSAVHQAHLSNTPILVLSADHECSDDGLETLQECYAETIYSSFCKVSKRIIHNTQYKYWVRRAIRESTRPPKRGPSVLVIELEALLGAPGGGAYPPEPRFYLENFTKEPISVPYPDPDYLEKIVKLIYEAKKPAMFVGDGILWSRAGKELVEFAELAKVPVMGRRGGRGAIPENHPLCYKSAGVVNNSDLFILWGAKLDFYDFWGQRWQISRTVQVNDDYRWIYGWLPTEVSLISDAGAALRQAIKYIKEKGLEPPADRDEWIKEVQKMEEGRIEHLNKTADRFKDRKPIHGLYLGKVIRDTIEDLYKNDVIYCGDSFTGWNVTSPFVMSVHEGYVLDSGQQAGVGHGIGQAIGAAIATDRKKMVFAMMGDAGIGLAGGDIDTAVRHKLPIVYCVYNNDLWYGDGIKAYGKKMEALKPPEGEFLPNFLQEDTRYDKMYEAIGCHGEWVQDPTEIRPALERAFKAAEKGQPAVVNVDVSNELIQAISDTPLVMMMFSHLPWNEIPVIHRKMRRKHLAQVFPFDKYNIELEDYDRYEREPNDFDIFG